MNLHQSSLNKGHFIFEVPALSFHIIYISYLLPFSSDFPGTADGVALADSGSVDGLDIVNVGIDWLLS